MGPAVNKSNEHYTYTDYLKWEGDERYELINGVVYNMSPAPSPKHQIVLVNLSTIFNLYLKGKPCQVYPAPFDVCLTEKQSTSDDKIDTVVQPDISIICDRSKLTKRGCTGAPDLIIEIISPSSIRHDLRVKKHLYEQYGVKEYWVVHPEEEAIVVFLLVNGQYQEKEIYEKASKIKVSFLGDLEVDLKEVFEE